MKNQHDSQYTIRFSFYNNRLYISMAVLYLLKRPQYIQLLISADKNTMFIKRCDTKERDSFNVPPRVYADAEYKFVLRKAPFSEAVCNMQNWDEKGRYRLFGSPVSDDVVAFDFSEAVRLDAIDS